MINNIFNVKLLMGGGFIRDSGDNLVHNLLSFGFSLYGGSLGTFLVGTCRRTMLNWVFIEHKTKIHLLNQQNLSDN